jgi:hypothetical protein
VAESWESHLQTLHRQFYETADGQCLLWVNPAQGDPFTEDPIVEERRVRVPIAHSRFDVRFAPYLVALDVSKSPDSDLFKASLQMAWEAWKLESLLARNGQPIAGWVVTTATPKTLAHYWASNCHLHFANGLSKLLRFHDPSAREWLWPILDRDQQQQLLGPAQSLIALNRQQNLMRQDAFVSARNANPEQSTRHGSTAQKLFLTATQWAQVDDYAAVHAAWLECCVLQPEYRVKSAQNPVWQQGVFAALQQASQYGIHDQQERTLFARHALQLGCDFHAHDKLQPVWKKTQAGEFYGAALEEVFGQPINEFPEYLKNI